MSAVNELEALVKTKTGITGGHTAYMVALNLANALKEIVDFGEMDMFGLKGYFINADSMNIHRALLFKQLGLATFPDHFGGGFCLLNNEGLKKYEQLNREGFYSPLK